MRNLIAALAIPLVLVGCSDDSGTKDSEKVAQEPAQISDSTACRVLVGEDRDGVVMQALELFAADEYSDADADELRDLADSMGDTAERWDSPAAGHLEELEGEADELAGMVDTGDFSDWDGTQTQLSIAEVLGVCDPELVSDEADDEPATDKKGFTQDELDAFFPKGYPKVVDVSSLPDQVRSWYEMSPGKKAVAIAPGVWAQISPGASAADAFNTGMFDGFCDSLIAYGNKYLGGQDPTSTCW